MKRNIVTWLMLLGCITIWAQGVKPLPTLHVEGRWLVDKHGNQVVLHGVMDTPNSYFNAGYWHGIWRNGWWDDYNDTGAANCLAYFEKLFDGMERAKCNVFRLHMDPAWTNLNAPSGTGENVITYFNEDRYRKYLESLYLELAKKAMNHGLYVVVRPPGVCPQNLKVGDDYQNYLFKVWDIFSQNDYVKEHFGQISIELANEPVNIKNASNQDDVTAMHDYFQPIVDKIRDNGFTGIIWVPGTGYQSNYRNYKTHPITGNNIGYAVHDYPGWYNSSDDNPDPNNKIANFHDAVPVVDTNPIFITEVDWSPMKEPKEQDKNADGTLKYNEMGQPVWKNLGTWATGSTSKWGNAFKAVLDRFENISMTLTHPHDFFNLEALVNQNIVEPAFDGNPEACAKACMDWYQDYYLINWPHADDEEETGDFYTLQKIEAEPGEVELMVGEEQLVLLKATYADEHTKEISASATYTIDDPTVVSITNGTIKALKGGNTKITASYKAPVGEEKQVVINVKVSSFDDWATLTSTTEIIGKTFVVMGTEDHKVFYCSDAQNLAYADAGSVLKNTGIVGYQFKAETIQISGHSNCYLLKQIKLDGTDYIMWTGKPGYLNSQAITGGWCCFVLGLQGNNGQVNGQDINNGAVWEINYVENKGFTLKNVGTGLYLKDASPAKYETPAYFTFRIKNPTSGIVTTTIQREIENDIIYNLQGVKMGRRSELHSLPSGIYIIGNKKVVVR